MHTVGRNIAARSWLACLLAVTFAVTGAASLGAEGTAAAEASARFRDEVEPVLIDHCYRCHADGVKKGGVSFDESPPEALVRDSALWSNVLKNVRAGLMPPAKRPRPSPGEVKVLEDWIKGGVLGIDPASPDPGRVTVRRLNRVEYRNTVRDLMGIDFRTDEEFPPDDTGYGFDNIGDVLSISPLLLEKYMQAAERIVARAVPTAPAAAPSQTFAGSEFRDGDLNGARLSFYQPATVSRRVRAETAGTYRVAVELSVRGGFDFDPGRCTLVLKAGDRELLSEELAWEDGKRHRYEVTETWEPGPKRLAFTLKPLTKPEAKVSSVDLVIASVTVEGPLEREHWTRPQNFDRFFNGDDPGPDPESRRRYARETLARFTTRAYRRPLDDAHLDRLVGLAETVYGEPGTTVAQGIANAMVAVLASPRFLFRVEESAPEDRDDPFPRVDEYSLASRLSYFLWSTMPDDELFALAARGALRKNLPAQVKRMMDDPRSEMLSRNFVGQWLQARDVEGVSIDAREVLARDDGVEKDLKRERLEFRALQAERLAQAKAQPKGEALPKGEAQPKGQAQQPRQQFRARFPNLFAEPRAQLDAPLRQAMRRETEMFFGSVVREDRSVLDLLDSDYTYLNERLAKHYGIPGVKGEGMRRVSLPADSPRGGLLTQGTVLVVTSNPTRTSPVKRGLFILDNFLGTPPPPPPPDIPDLEATERSFTDREPTLREVLELHRAQPLCNSCHSRMDPLGLALENFNALGLWRDTERKLPLDTAGTLITGEPFAGVRDLKRILKQERRSDFYRCLTEKMLTYALGRGLADTDVESVDRIVARVENGQGRFSSLLTGVIDSAPFQRRRNVPAEPVSPAGRAETHNPTADMP